MLRHNTTVAGFWNSRVRVTGVPRVVVRRGPSRNEAYCAASPPQYACMHSNAANMRKKKLLVKGLGNESLLHPCYVIRWHVFMSGFAADRLLPIGHAPVSSHDLTNLQDFISHSPVAKTVTEASTSQSEQELVSHDLVLIMHFIRTMLAVSDSVGPSQPSTRMKEMMDCLLLLIKKFR
jgi:hypothetical protein